MQSGRTSTGASDTVGRVFSHAVVLAVALAATVALVTASVPAAARRGVDDTAPLTLRQATQQWIDTARNESPSEVSGRPSSASRAHRRTPVSGLCDQPIVTDKRGDNKPVDIVSSTLTSDCAQWTVTTRLAKPLRLDRLNVWSLELNTARGRGGCAGAEFVLLAVVERGRLVGYLLETPLCDPDYWTTWETFPIDRPDARTLTATFSAATIKRPFAFSWRTVVDGRGTGDVDIAPDDGTWVKVRWPPPGPAELDVWVMRDSVRVGWQQGAARTTYELMLGKVGETPAVVPRQNPRATSEVLRDLEPGAMYVLTITAELRGMTSRPVVQQFTFIYDEEVL